MVVTSNQSIPYIPFFPDDVLSSEPIYVAYHFYGAGHYDATDPMYEADEKPGANISPLKMGACYCGQRSKTREKLFCTSGGDAKETRCPCAVGNRCCTSFCKCFNCGNRPPGNNQSSCRCGANYKNGGEEVKSFTDTTGKRQTKWKCYKEMRPCTNKCGCYGCSNDYGRREASNVSSPQKRNIKCTSSPSCLKRRRTDKFFSENDFEIKEGSWTTEETCLLEAFILFLSSASIVLSEENITNMYNFVCTSAFTYIANCKSEGQIKGKLSYVKSRQHAIRKMLYGIAVLVSQTWTSAYIASINSQLNSDTVNKISFVQPKTCSQLLKRRINDWITWLFITVFLCEKGYLLRLLL